MDPGTQRMLERARARRQKLDSQLQSSGHEVTRKRSPLQETQTQMFKVTTEVEVTLSNPRGGDLGKDVTVSPTKVEFSNKENKEMTLSGGSPEVKTFADTCNTMLLRDELKADKQTFNKESVRKTASTASSGPMRDGVRSKLQRLGVLYSDSQISSPIHRTEGNFSSEPIEESKQVKAPARVARLAALANTIKQWEDDVNHPQPTSGEEICEESQGFSRSVSNSRLVYDYSKRSSQDHGEKSISPNKDTSVAATNVLKKLASVKEQIEPSPQKSKTKCNFEANSTKESHAVFLEAASLHGASEKLTPRQEVGSPQSFNSTSNKSTVGKDGDSPLKLNSSPERNVLFKEGGSPQRFNSSPNHSAAWKGDGSPRRFNNSPNKLNLLKEGGSPQRFISSPNNSAVWRAEGSPRRFDLSPTGLKSTGDGSVLHKAAMFESTSPNKKSNKDPTELSVAERLALFERNKGQALIPKAAFSMSVPAKYLDKNDNVKRDGKKVLAEGVQTLEKPNNFIMRAENIGSTPLVSESRELQRPPAPMTHTSELNKVLAQRQKFEQGAVLHSDNGIARSIQVERQREMNMLLNRWNKNKRMASGDDETSCNQQQENCFPPPPPPPPLLPPPEALSPSSLRQSPSKLPLVVNMSPKPLPTQMNLQETLNVNLKPSAPTMPVFNNRQDVTANKCRGSGMASYSTRQYPEVKDIKRIKVSPPKPGNLYPCLSDIEAATETESEAPNEDEEDQDYASSSELDTSSNLGDTSFGREILQAAGIQKSPLASQARRQVSSDSDLSEAESAVLEDIDDFLDEALGDDSSSEQEGPTPPKRSRETSQITFQDLSPTTTQSQSFRYSRPVDISPQYMPTHVIDGEHQMPLMHTVSFYRRQQNMALKNTPVKQVVRKPQTTHLSATNATVSPTDAERVRCKISLLLDEVSKQQTVISQASQALNLCGSTVEFSGSAEEVEGERLLLLATHKRQAALHEIQRLKVEGSLKPVSQSGQTPELLDKGTLTITDIVLPLKKEYLRNMAADNMCHHLLCLVRSHDQVLATQVLAAVPENLQHSTGLVWSTPLTLADLYGDFKVTLEVYSLQAHKEMLPHNIKYHIGNKKETSKLRLTPKKLLKQESRLMMPTVQSPAGPSAVRSPSFHLAGYVVFSLKEVTRSHFTLNKVTYTSPLEGNIQLKMNSELSLEVTERGFLTMFEDVSGFGAWHRRWYLLKGHVLAYWKYPDDEKKKEPIGLIDLNTCTTQKIGLVSRDICARPNTFLLETRRQTLPDDEDSLVLVRSHDCTTIRNLLSADTREERLQWCAQLNKALSMIRAWSGKSKC